jgi:hypothetical protein
VTRRRTTALVAGILVVVVLVIAVAGAAYVTQSAPLEVGSSWAAPPAARDIGVGYEGRKQFQVAFDEDAEIVWGVEVRNPLAVPVTVRGLRPAFDDIVPLVTGEELLLGRVGEASLEPGDLRAFEPVDLGPGERAFLVVREGYAVCEEARAAWAPGGGVVRSTLPLEVAVLAIQRSIDLELPFDVLYSSPPGDCPAS